MVCDGEGTRRPTYRSSTRRASHRAMAARTPSLSGAECGVRPEPSGDENRRSRKQNWASGRAWRAQATDGSPTTRAPRLGPDSGNLSRRKRQRSSYAAAATMYGWEHDAPFGGDREMSPIDERRPENDAGADPTPSRKRPSALYDRFARAFWDDAEITMSAKKLSGPRRDRGRPAYSDP